MYRRIKLLLMTGLLLVLGTSSAFSQELVETGFLRDNTGHPISKNAQMRYRIYTQQTGGTPIWDSGVIGVTVNEGLYSVSLGRAPQPPIDDTIITTSGDYYIEYQIDGDTFTNRDSLAYNARSIWADRALKANVAISMDAKGLTGIIQADNNSVAISGTLNVTGILSANYIIGDGSQLHNVAQYKRGQGVFSAGKNQITVSDNFSTTDTIIYLNILNSTSVAGVWQVQSTNGQFIIDSDRTESNTIPFEYFMVRTN